MGRASRTKGKRAEAEVCAILTERGMDHDRTLDGRRQPTGDIRLPGMALEVRRREQVSITRWSRDHEALAPDHLIPAVAYRTNGEPWRVSLPLADLLDLIEAAEG